MSEQADRYHVEEIVMHAASLGSRPLALRLVRALAKIGEEETSPAAWLLYERAVGALKRLEGPDGN